MFTSRRIAIMGGDKFRDDYSIHFDNDNGDFIAVTETGFSVHDTAHSFSFWCKRDSIDSYDIVLGNQSESNYNFIIFDDSDGNRLMLEGANGDTAVGVCSVVAGRWYHFVVVCNADDTHLMYQDGVALTMSDNEMTTDVSIDAIGGSSANVFNGNISDVAIYNTALSASQVKTLYNGREPFDHKSGSLSKNLIHWWRMGDGLENAAGTTVYDLAGSLNGTMTNMDATDYEEDTPW